MGDNKPRVFRWPKQVYLTHPPRICLITCRREVLTQEIHQDVCLLLIVYKWEACRKEVRQDMCLPLIGPGGKHSLMGSPL